MDTLCDSSDWLVLEWVSRTLLLSIFMMLPVLMFYIPVVSTDQHHDLRLCTYHTFEVLHSRLAGVSLYEARTHFWAGLSLAYVHTSVVYLHRIQILPLSHNFIIIIIKPRDYASRSVIAEPKSTGLSDTCHAKLDPRFSNVTSSNPPTFHPLSTHNHLSNIIKQPLYVSHAWYYTLCDFFNAFS